MVFIKNFEMPKDCNHCPFYQYEDDNSDYCGIEYVDLRFVKKGERHESCPLVDTNPKTAEDAGQFQLGYDIAIKEIQEKLKNCP